MSLCEAAGFSGRVTTENLNDDCTKPGLLAVDAEPVTDR